MKRDRMSVVAAIVAAALVVGLALPWTADAQNALVRLVAQHKRWDFTESSTSSGIPGTAIYEKSVFVPASVNTLYITVAGTGDGHEGAGIALGCFVGESPCNAGMTLSPHFTNEEFLFDEGLPNSPGFIVLQRHNAARTFPGTVGDATLGAEDYHDNSFHYTWCKQVQGGTTHSVIIKLAAAGGVEFSEAFVEGLHFFIDGNTPTAANRCTQAPLTLDEIGFTESPPPIAPIE